MRKNTKWNNFSRLLFTRPNTIGLFVFIIMLILIGFVVRLRYSIAIEGQHREMNNILNVVHNNISQILKNSYSTNYTLALTINDAGEPENFNEIAPQLLKSNPNIDAIELLPNGVIKYVYPLKGNENALNYDIIKSSDLEQDVKASTLSKGIHFVGPLELKQGGLGIIGRLPIYKKNKFWGFAAVVIRLESLFKNSGIKSIDESKYYFQFSKADPYNGKEKFYLPKINDFSKKEHIAANISEGNWKLYLITRDKSVIFPQVIFSIVLGSLLCIISGFWVTSILKKPAQLQKLILKQARKILNTETEFKAIFDQAPVGIVRVDGTTGNFIEVNKEYCKIVGYSEEELKKINFQKITKPDDLEEELKNMENLKNQKINEFSMEKRYIHKKGNIIWVNLLVSNILTVDDTPGYIIGIVEDITEKKRTEEELKQSFELVSEQNKRLLNFSYIVSHNLRSHTSNIEMISSFLETANNKEERDEMIDLLKKVSHSLNETIYNLNEVVSIRNNINLLVEKVNVHEYIEKTRIVLAEQIQKKHAKINNLVSTTIEVDYNIAYFESIIYNFISNAIRYSHPDRTPEITLSFNEDKRALIISDNGIGIDLKKNGDKLFGMYKTFNNNPDSKGIGLFITKNQIDAMGGRIETESEINKGTTFTLFFK
ncbi:PAS domain S-box protein [Flavobacterium sp.]|jgi:PAS domain S-box-containing protein|uniref:PAS domain S-box protein n=1 Tax=Flavobacterium sp. TaxID=239 RepID=UPI0037BEF997